jgi:hypothetical protein
MAAAVETNTRAASCGLSKTEGQACAAHVVFSNFLMVCIACNLFGLVAKPLGC